MGVRYNAEKKKIGNYYSTPIYSFRCKCHLCDNWFTIETDPKNTRYVVASGARKKEEDWDPEENGGFAIHDPDKAGPSDPLATLEKTAQAESDLKTIQKPRIEALQSLSDHYNSDPFTHSARVRKYFRSEKKLDAARKEADDIVKDKYALPESLQLETENESTKAEARQAFILGKNEQRANDESRQRRLEEAETGSIGPSLFSKRTFDQGWRESLVQRHKRNFDRNKSTIDVAGGASSSLRSRLLQNTARNSDPFLKQGRTKPPDAKLLGVAVKRHTKTS
ncbi:hypothetical protein PNOK_0815600 [Pyrrhoderma noxium]|uniref:Uncharacterized protein n=1 Tax=Pyrrhoderma noxium TaxID=2282107 RepID=A0A286UAF6_9AGAM|nr:hypothetical protein PNOK_0815600 [Pyrrhoderma noxium]